MHGRSAVFYEQAARDLILKFKHGDRTDITPLFVNWLKISYDSFSYLPDYIVPVPLHTRRLIKRQYNQSQLLARELAKHIDVPCLAVLKRHIATPPQQNLNKRQRQQNIADAFSVRPKQLPNVQGKHFMIIDDVWTTGATLIECGKTLLEAGAKDVSFLTVARVRHI